MKCIVFIFIENVPKSFVGFTPKKGKGNSTVGHLFGHYAYETDPYESRKLTDMVICFSNRHVLTFVSTKEPSMRIKN